MYKVIVDDVAPLLVNYLHLFEVLQQHSHQYVVRLVYFQQINIHLVIDVVQQTVVVGKGLALEKMEYALEEAVYSANYHK